MKSFCAAMGAISLMGASVATAAPQASGPSTSAPTLVRIDGQLKTPRGDARTGSVTLVVSLYGEQEDATPLWVESQVVTLDAAGRYTIFAGATLADGVPTEFLSGATAGRWLGVAAQGEAEQFRMMLVTVPYAAKAREADTLAGKSVGDFVLTSNLTDTVKAALKASGVGLAGGSSTNGTGPGVSGTLNVIQKGAGGAAIADATGFVEVGGSVGIGTASPGALLDVSQPTTGATAVFVRNPTAGPGNYARLDIKTDTAGGRGLFDAYSSTFTTSANSVQSGVSFTAIGAGGFSIALQDPNAPMRFYTGAGPSERMRIDNSGKVAIGTITPTGAKLSVDGGSGTGVYSATTGGIGVWGNSGSGTGVHGVSNSYVGVSGVSETSTGVSGASFSGTGVYGVSSHGYAGLFVGDVSATGSVYAGSVGIGTSDVFSAKLHVNGGSGGALNAETTTGTAVHAVSGSSLGLYAQSLSGCCAAYFIGDVHVFGAVIQESDVRLKQAIHDLGYGLHDVLQLRPVSFTWKHKSDGRVQLGLIAQEVEAVVPELVTTDTDAEQTKKVNYIGLVPVVIKAIQEQQDSITALNAENTALKERNQTLQQRDAELDARLAALEQTLQQLLAQQQGHAQPSRIRSLSQE